MKKTNSTIKLLCVFISLSLLVVFVPGAKETISGIFESSENFQPVYVNVGDFNLKWDIKFELPTFQFDTENIVNPTLNISASFVIVAIIVALLSIILSFFFQAASPLATFLFGIFGFYFSFQIFNVCKVLISNGNTSWETANSCFWLLFSFFLIVMAMGLFNLGSTIVGTQVNDAISSTVYGILLALAVAAVGSFIVSGLCWLILGLGWNGAIFLCCGIAFLIAIAGEFINSWLNSDSIEDYNSNYDYAYDEDYE